ncbi:hypothetical protein [Arthrobacter sp. ISL-28]|nr:hypothetical protein [Arthrobacter sp. ISL-28]
MQFGRRGAHVVVTARNQEALRRVPGVCAPTASGSG